MRFSFKTPPQMTGWGALREFWLAADDIDLFTAGWTFDHFYPLQEAAPSGPCFEGWMALAVLAALTRRIRLGVMVSAVPYRHPAVLANMVATLDVASDGRVQLGLGAGWNTTETTAYGIDLPPLRERFDRLDEACHVIDGLLTKPATTFAGRYYQLNEARCEPKPIQQPRPPIVIGGGGEQRTLRIAAKWADEWNLAGGPVDVFRHKLGVLHGYCNSIGRDPAAIEPSVQVQAGEPAQTAEMAARLAEAGASHVVVVFRSPLDARLLEPMAESLDALR